MDQLETELKYFIRGGQIVQHYVRMFNQIFNKVFSIAIFLFLFAFIFLGFLSTTSYERYVTYQYASSPIWLALNSKASDFFVEPDGLKVKVLIKDIHDSPAVHRVVSKVAYKLCVVTLISLLFVGFVYYWMDSWLRKRGKTHTQNNQLRGDRLATVEETSAIIRNATTISNLDLAGVPLPEAVECSHMLFHGTVGTGKSTAIKSQLDQVRKNKHKAIIYDKGGNFLQEFYVPGKDVLLNPLDERSSGWGMWRECREQADFDNLAAAQIPMPLSSQDPFWVNAARTIFSTAAYEMRNDPDKSIIKLLRYLLTSDLEQMQKFLKGTEAESLISEKIEKTAISIKAVLATYLKSLKYVKEDETHFSIRDWVRDEEADNWLFITSVGEKHETLKPLITMWLDIAVNSILSLAPSFNRRIWLGLDELTTLNQLPYLAPVLSEGRKFGACGLIGIQNYAQWERVYSTAGARELSALINTRMLFRQPDPNIAAWSASNFGEAIVDEAREGLSYGANTMRDGVNINRVETRKQLVSSSEIMQLPNLTAYLRLPGDYPITKVHFERKNREILNEYFMPREMEDGKLGEVDELIKKYETVYSLTNPGERSTIDF